MPHSNDHRKRPLGGHKSDPNISSRRHNVWTLAWCPKILVLATTWAFTTNGGGLYKPLASRACARLSGVTRDVDAPLPTRDLQGSPWRPIWLCAWKTQKAMP